MNNKNLSLTIFSQLNSPDKSKNYSHHSIIPLALDRIRQKSQISSIRGIPPKAQNRYRVTLGDQTLGDYLTLNEALKLAKGGEA